MGKCYKFKKEEILLAVNTIIKVEGTLRGRKQKNNLSLIVSNTSINCDKFFYVAENGKKLMIFSDNVIKAGTNIVDEYKDSWKIWSTLPEGYFNYREILNRENF